MQSLSQKITTSFGQTIRWVLLIVAIEGIIISGILAILYLSKANRSVLEQYTAEIDTAMEAKVSILETIAAGINSGTLTEKEDIQKYVDSIQALDNQVSAIYSCYDDNVTVMSGGWTPPADFIVTEREWYIKAQENPEEVYISEPYVDVQTGGICITLAKATYKDGKTAGVVGLDMYMDDLVSFLEKSYSKGSYIFLTTGTILVHPNEAYAITAEKSSNVSDANTNKGRYAPLLKEGVQSKILPDYKGGLKLAISTDSQVTDWKIISISPLSTILIFIFVLLIIRNYLCRNTADCQKQYNQKSKQIFPAFGIYLSETAFDCRRRSFCCI